METVSELLDRLVPAHFPKLARRTQVDNLRHVEALKQLWGNVPADQLTARMIGQWMNGGPARGRIQRGKIVSLLATMYKYAVGEWFIVDSNPTRDLRMPKGNHRTRYITDAEFEAVRSVASPRLRAAMDLALLTGQHRGKAVTDISKCQGIQCEKRESCWRFTAPAGIWQSWITVLTPEDCGHYWPIAPSKPRDTSTASGEQK